MKARSIGYWVTAGLIAGLATVMGIGCSATNDVQPGDESGAGSSGSASSGSAGVGSASTSGSGTGGAGSSSTGSVTFDWPESTGPCRDGHYVGAFECMYVPQQGGAPFPVNGTVDFFLQKMMNGEVFDIGNGKLQSISGGVFLLTADLQGKLDCGQKQFDGVLVNGTYSGFIIINGMFDGPLSADYDPVIPGFVNGKWELHELTSSFGTCLGTWYANWVP
jgi:hypothetical protein